MVLKVSVELVRVMPVAVVGVLVEVNPAVGGGVTAVTCWLALLYHALRAAACIAVNVSDDEMGGIEKSLFKEVDVLR